MKVQQRKGHILHVPMVLPCSPQPAAPWAPCAHPQWYQSISRGLCGTEPRSAGLAGSSARLLGAGCVTPPTALCPLCCPNSLGQGHGGAEIPMLRLALPACGAMGTRCAQLGWKARTAGAGPGTVWSMGTRGRG